MSVRSTPKQNFLLAAMPPAEYKRFAGKLKSAKMLLGMTVYEANVPLKYAYFPTSSVISMVSEMANGDTAEIAVTGNEGMVGTPLAMGGSTASNRAVVQCAGTAYRTTARELAKELDHNGALRNLTLHYTQALMTQMAQTVVCNRHHPVAQQLCRWLLLSLDRLPTNVVLMTDGLVANMLGLRLRGVMTAAGKLQSEGLIKYYRGRITVLDRPRMEKRACACYRIVRNEELRLLPQKSGKAS
ncbi:MAG: Crp/Fnr family transcriptional regulator [Betaproteobacteria bacterium]